VECELFLGSGDQHEAYVRDFSNFRFFHSRRDACSGFKLYPSCLWVVRGGSNPSASLSARLAPVLVLRTSGVFVLVLYEGVFWFFLLLPYQLFRVDNHLLLSCLTCNHLLLLLPINEYAEGPVEIRGRSKPCPRKVRFLYEDSPLLRTRKVFRLCRFPLAVVGKIIVYNNRVYAEGP